MKLISMTDFVLNLDNEDLNEQKIQSIFDYANFLKQPITLGMFFPCDDEGNVLKEPIPFDCTDLEYHIWCMAKEKVLFKGFEVKKTQSSHLYELFKNGNFMFTYNSSTYVFLIVGSTIENLVKYNLEINNK